MSSATHRHVTFIFKAALSAGFRFHRSAVLPRWVFWPVVLAAVLCPSAVRAAEGGPGEDADIEIGGPGNGNGQFLELRDIVFDRQNRLYVLEGRRLDNETKGWVGNCRVQVFDAQAKYLDQFSIGSEKLDEKRDPSRIAVDSGGRVFITEPATGVVLQYRGSPWKLQTRYEIPDAFGVAVWNAGGRERIVVAARRYEQNQWVPVEQLQVIDPQQGKLVAPLKLSRGVAGVMDVTADDQGNLYVLAEVNQLYKFDPSGRLQAVVGSGTFRRHGDGSELRHSVAVDPQRRIYSQAWGRIARFEPDLKSVTLKVGQFYWYDNWSPHDAYTPFALDGDGRFWLAGTGKVALGVRHHYRPCVMRVREDYFDKLKPESTLGLGFDPQITTSLPYNVTCELAPIELEFVVGQAYRRIHDVVVDYVVYDVSKTQVAKGSFDLKLEDGTETRRAFGFKPPRYGWYTVQCATRTRQGEPVFAVGTHVGVTPQYPGLPVLAEGDSPGGWVDPAKHAFCGMHLMRLHTNQGAELIEKTIDQARKLGVNVVVQFQDREHCAADQVREFVTRFKGRVKCWEIVNEPNFSMQPAQYAELLARVYPLIKQIDPQAQVMGPAVCGINLGWHEAVFKAGGGRHLDLISIHDYEGNESVDPGHWHWKIGQLRKLMAEHQVGNKPIWQTERAMGGVRANTFLGGVQAVRVGLQRDVMETLGVPNEHNLHYYMNQAGYGAVPTYLWSSSGPHPTALALRTRAAMVRERRYAGTLDFGPDGNKLFLALRYAGQDGSTIVLRQYGAAVDPPLELGVAGGSELEIVDSFGNSRKLAVRDGKVKLTVPLLPVYLRLAKGQKVSPPVIDHGRNLATDATLVYSGKTTSDVAILTNGLFEVTHAGSPWGPHWAGELKTPQTLEIQFAQPRPLNRVVVYSMRADNPHCYLADFDVQYHDGRQWKTLDEIRTPLPPSDAVRTAESGANTWYLDQNLAVVEFPTVTADKLRIVARRSTLGFHPDEVAVEATGWQAGGPNLHLREIEVFGPPPVVELTARLAEADKTAAFAREPVEVKVANRSDRPIEVIARLAAPEGWSTEPPEVRLVVDAGGTRGTTFQLVAPEDIPTGRIPLDVAVFDAQGKSLDYRRVTLTVEPPVSVTPLAPPAIAPAQQPLAVEVKNLTDRPVAGRIQLMMAGGKPQESIEAIEKPFDAIGPQESRKMELVVPGLKLSEAAWKARYRVTTEHLVTEAVQDFAQSRLWQVIGPLPSPDGKAFDTVYEPERRVDLSQKIAAANGGQASWRPAMNDSRGFIDLTKVCGPLEQVCAYAVIYVKSPSAQQALLSAGSDDGIKAWINGKLVASHDITRGAAPGQEEAQVELRAGWNEVLLKITQGKSGWGFYFDLLGSEGQPLPKVVYAPGPGG